MEEIEPVQKRAKELRLQVIHRQRKNQPDTTIEALAQIADDLVILLNSPLTSVLTSLIDEEKTISSEHLQSAYEELSLLRSRFESLDTQIVLLGRIHQINVYGDDNPFLEPDGLS